jgi:hypothetical protein
VRGFVVREQCAAMSFHEAHSSLQDGVHKLLSCPSPSAMQRYYEQLSTSGLGPGLQVRYIGGEMGKGVFAVKDFNAEEVVLQEPMLVGAQHSSNKVSVHGQTFLHHDFTYSLQSSRNPLLRNFCFPLNI